MTGASTEIESLSADIIGLEMRVEARGVPRDDHGVLAFKGIPYAAPPIGDLRWHAPQPPYTWAGVREATQFGARCWSAGAMKPAEGAGRKRGPVIEMA